jgi:hypothetical protein
MRKPNEPERRGTRTEPTSCRFPRTNPSRADPNEPESRGRPRAGRQRRGDRPAHPRGA